jgi:hypothetical protein
MILREFNEAGITAFQSFLATCRATPTTPYPHQLLEDGALTMPLTPRINVEFRRLGTRGEAAHFLKSLLAPLPEQSVADNSGLWTWLSLLFFDEVCPVKNGKRVVRNDYTYVFEPKNARHFYRHLLYISWHVLRVAPEHNRLFLSTALASLDKVTSEVMKRLYLTRIPCMFAVLDRLYWDERRGRARPGITDVNVVRPGDLTHRLPLRIRQLEMTYDLHSLNAGQLVELLGDEFKHTVETHKRVRSR